MYNFIKFPLMAMLFFLSLTIITCNTEKTALAGKQGNTFILKMNNPGTPLIINSNDTKTIWVASLEKVENILNGILADEGFYLADAVSVKKKRNDDDDNDDDGGEDIVPGTHENPEDAETAASKKTKGGACFIATAAYGSPMENHVVILRKFRDTYLLSCEPGRMFVRTYNRYSPPMADFISKSPFLKAVVRVCLIPAVGTSCLALSMGMKVTAALYFSSFILLIIIARYYRNAVKTRTANF